MVKVHLNYIYTDLCIIGGFKQIVQYDSLKDFYAILLLKLLPSEQAFMVSEGTL